MSALPKDIGFRAIVTTLPSVRMPTRIPIPLILLQRIVAFTALALALFALVRLSFVQGIFRRVSIDGPSMAPHLLGTHFNVTCADCRFLFPCDAEHLPSDKLAACPNCGYTNNRLDQAQLLPPDRVLIDRWPILWSAPQRGTVVAIALPDSSDLAVKRIAALPGERIAIQDGDLFVGGQIIRKTATELHSVRLLVHDNAFLPLPLGEGRGEGLKTGQNLPPRWRPTIAPSSWQATPTGFRAAPSVISDSIDWLHYENWKNTADPRSRGIASYVTDNDSYNQGETRRPLNAVTDVFFSCRLRAADQGQLILVATAGDQRFELTIEPRQSATLRHGDRTLTTQRLRTNLSRRFVRLEFGLCDQQILLVIDGRTLIRHPYERPREPQTEPLHPLAIGTRGLHIEITEPRIWRDIYYLDPQGLSRPWESSAPLASGEYALLGDNQPVSIDSRHWQPAAIPRSAILGHVYQPFWTAFRRLD